MATVAKAETNLQTIMRDLSRGNPVSSARIKRMAGELLAARLRIAQLEGGFSLPRVPAFEEYPFPEDILPPLESLPA